MGGLSQVSGLEHAFWSSERLRREGVMVSNTNNSRAIEWDEILIRVYSMLVFNYVKSPCPKHSPQVFVLFSCFSLSRSFFFVFDI